MSFLELNARDILSEKVKEESLFWYGFFKEKPKQDGTIILAEATKFPAQIIYINLSHPVFKIHAIGKSLTGLELWGLMVAGVWVLADENPENLPREFVEKYPFVKELGKAYEELKEKRH